jgi:BMFP domain-containing protein YqiC
MDDDQLEYDELIRVVARAKEERRLLCQRIGLLEGEKAALMAIVQELQADLQAARAYIVELDPIPG